jgi:hypothetical protein
MPLNRQTLHFLRPETKRYGFQDLDGQTDRQTNIVTVPKTCEVNEKKSKRRTNRYTHTMFVIIYKIVGPHVFVENEQWNVVCMKEEFHVKFVAIL